MPDRDPYAQTKKVLKFGWVFWLSSFLGPAGPLCVCLYTFTEPVLRGTGRFLRQLSSDTNRFVRNHPRGVKLTLRIVLNILYMGIPELIWQTYLYLGKHHRITVEQTEQRRVRAEEAKRPTPEQVRANRIRQASSRRQTLIDAIPADLPEPIRRRVVARIEREYREAIASE